MAILNIHIVDGMIVGMLDIVLVRMVDNKNADMVDNRSEMRLCNPSVLETRPKAYRCGRFVNR